MCRVSRIWKRPKQNGIFLLRYLKHPAKLFLHLRDEHGEMQLSKRAATFHPGRGVYRSSHKNARRLAATETNMAYRTADYLRWQQMDFVVGIEICLSNNHTVLLQPGETTADPKMLNKNGHPKANATRPLTDICDTLCGRYPKDFKFTGWHPQCRCYAVTILKTDEVMAEDNRRILAGEEPTADSVNTVQDVPKQFKEWVKKNEEKINGAEQERLSMPYFLRDNRDIYRNILTPQKPKESSLKRIKADIDTSNGGKVRTHPNRIENSIINKRENIKFKKELRMGYVMARNGHSVELTQEISGISSSDALIDGVRVEFKSLKNSNNIRRHINDAFERQRAERVLIELGQITSVEIKEIIKQQSKGRHGWYYLKGTFELFDF